LSAVYDGNPAIFLFLKFVMSPILGIEILEENLVFIFRHSFIQLLLMNTAKCHVWFCFHLLTENLPGPGGPVGL